MKLRTMRELFFQQLRELHDCEVELVEGLGKLAGKARHQELRDLFEEDKSRTEEQVRRLESVFQDLGEELDSQKCQGIRTILKESDDLAGKTEGDSIIDAGLIASGRKAKNYEIAAYATVTAWAEKMGHPQAAALLRQTLDEEEEASRALAELAGHMVNPVAVASGDAGTGERSTEPDRPGTKG